MPDITIDIDTGKKCSRCGELGATPNGLCMRCIGDRITGGANVEFTGMIDGTRTKVKIDKREGGAKTGRVLMEVKVVLPYNSQTAAYIETHQGEALRFTIDQAQEEMEL